jgi:NADPH-dependent 2,4-dienoyl-CoA reductase/sulfur reductase-like enzyme/rhodanese-related sulfurtransferase
MPRQIRIVGGVAAGMSAATRMRRLDEFAQITVYERGPYVSFANCGLPYHLGGEIAERGKLIVQSPARLKNVFQLDVRANTEVVAVRPKLKEIDIRHEGRTSTETYDELILATGASAIVPNVPGIESPNHFFLRTIPDLDAIMARIEATAAKSALVLGGGFIGLEAAEQLHRRGMHVTVVEKNPQVLTPLDPEMAAHLQIELAKKGIALKLANPVVGFEDGTAVLQTGERIAAEIVIVGIGVKPETSLARAAGLEIGRSGGIKVNEFLQTSDPHIWAAGDAIEVGHFVTGEPSVIPLAGPANRQGRMIADNILGRGKSYEGTLGTAIVRVFDLAAACTGANEKTLKRLGRTYEVVHLHPNSHAGYFPGAKSLAMKLLFDPDTGAILGAQVVGEDGADKRIDVIATAIRAGMTIDDLADLELAYAPPYGSAKDPVNLMGMAAQNIGDELVHVVQWHEVAAVLSSGTHTILDVREPGERDGGIIPGSFSIPLGDLRRRMGELSKDRPILVHCASGQRSYNACRVLMQHGFDCKNLTGSYKTWIAAQSAGVPSSHGEMR